MKYHTFDLDAHCFEPNYVRLILIVFSRALSLTLILYSVFGFRFFFFFSFSVMHISMSYALRNSTSYRTTCNVHTTFLLLFFIFIITISVGEPFALRLILFAWVGWRKGDGSEEKENELKI